jgi:RimJ/RimL family protein N-acetyltransferase
MRVPPRRTFYQSDQTPSALRREGIPRSRNHRKIPAYQDAETIAAILREPEVENRWGPSSKESVLADFIESDAAFVIEVDKQVVGAIQYGEEVNPIYRHASIDLFVTTERWGEGIGSDAILTLARYLSPSNSRWDG